MVKCVSLSPTEYLFYDEDSAAIVLTYRSGANYGTNFLGESLAPEEIDRLIDNNDMIEIRDLSDDEEEIISGIRLWHPEVKHIVSKLGQSVTAAEPSKSVPTKSTPGKGGLFPKLADMVGNIFRKALPEAEDKVQLQKFLKHNWGNLEKIQKQIRNDKPLMDHLERSVKSGKLDVGGLTAMTELLKSDPSWLKALDLSPTNIAGPSLTIPISILPRMSGLTDVSNDELIHQEVDKLIKRAGIRKVSVEVLPLSDRKVNPVEKEIETLRKKIKEQGDERDPALVQELEEKQSAFKERALKDLSGERFVDLNGPWESIVKLKRVFKIDPKEVTKAL